MANVYFNKSTIYTSCKLTFYRWIWKIYLDRLYAVFINFIHLLERKINYIKSSKTLTFLSEISDKLILVILICENIKYLHFSKYITNSIVIFKSIGYFLYSIFYSIILFFLFIIYLSKNIFSLSSVLKNIYFKLFKYNIL